MISHTYHITGMSCMGCRQHVDDALKSIEGVEEVKVDLEKAEALIVSIKPIPIATLKAALKSAGAQYDIHEGLKESKTNVPPKQSSGSGIYYCPMLCENDKVYTAPGSCPVCGMNLIEQPSITATKVDEKEDIQYLDLIFKFKIAVLFTLPLFIIAMSDMIPGQPLFKIMPPNYWNWIQFSLSLPVVFYSGWMLFQRAYASFIRRHLNMFSLIGIGAGVAWIFSCIALMFPDIFPSEFKNHHGSIHLYFEAATVILTLVLLGQLLEARAHSKTNNAVKELLKLSPDTAHRMHGDQEENITIDQINIGDILMVKPGERIPVDGTILSGNAIIDESMITGEPIPVDKKAGDNVGTGTINTTGSFLMKAEKVGADTLLSRIIEMVNQAGMSRAPIQKTADTISAYFVPIVIVISILTFFIWYALGPEPKLVYGLINATAVLIIACPCALGLATPMSIMVGVGKGAQSGVLVKNAEAIEQMHKVTTLVVDKTGTLTEGHPKIDTILSTLPSDELAHYLVSINSQSEHPLAKATVEHFSTQNIGALHASNFQSITGKGVVAALNDKQIALGNEALMELLNITPDEELYRKANEKRSEGKTVSYLAVNSKLSAVVVYFDPIKKTTKQAIQSLNKQGIEVIMLTGDNFLTAKYVANQLQIDNYKAQCLPEDKLTYIQELKSSGKIVAMAGDGINDAPALAVSDVGIAMGTGTDIAIESSDVTLIKGDLTGIVKARTLSELVMRNIRQNLFFALIYNLLGVPVAAGVLYPIFGVLLSPMIAAVAMSFSSVSVISNALRLRSKII